MDGSISTNLPELSVSELAGAVKRTMETTFDRVRVRGELGRVVIAKSGHLYADLKDENACITLVMWRSNAQALRFRAEEGLEVVAEGRLSTFPNKSQYQIIAERMEPAGVGALMALLEERKRKLAAEGLFEAGRKRSLPYLPRVIGVVTSPSGAVIRDILHRLAERFPRRVLLWPVLVQGEHAAGQVAAAIRGFNAIEPGGPVPRPDVLIVARGGGSIEDLWAFNEEIVVRAAAESRIPLISAVGHETDVTLIDHAADKRAPTPTAAAEMAVPVRAELVERVTGAGARLVSGSTRLVERRRVELRAAAARLPRPQTLLGLAQQRFDRAGERLAGAVLANAQAARGRLDRTSVRLRPQALAVDLKRRRERLEEVSRRAAAAMERLLDRRRVSIEGAGRLLLTLSHQSVLARGFALVQRPDGSLVRRAAEVSPGEPLELTFADGQVPVGGSTQGQPKRRKGGGAEDQGALF